MLYPLVLVNVSVDLISGVKVCLLYVCDGSVKLLYSRDLHLMTVILLKYGQFPEHCSVFNLLCVLSCLEPAFVGYQVLTTCL